MIRKIFILTFALLAIFIIDGNVYAFVGCDSAFKHILIPLEEGEISLRKISVNIKGGSDATTSLNINYELENNSELHHTIKLGIPYSLDSSAYGYYCSNEIGYEVDGKGDSLITKYDTYVPESFISLGGVAVKSFIVHFDAKEKKNITLYASFFEPYHPLGENFDLDMTYLGLWHGNPENTELEIIVSGSYAEDLTAPYIIISPDNYSINGNVITWKKLPSKISFRTDHTLPEPKASPDDKFMGSIVFNKGNSIYLINGKTPEKAIRLTPKSEKYRSGFTDPTWVEEGIRIAFKGKFNLDKSEIMTMKPDGTQIEQITNLGGRLHEFIWLENEKLLYFELTKGKEFKKPFVIDLQTRKIRSYPKELEIDRSWSYDKSKYVKTGYSDTSIYDNEDVLIKDLNDAFARPIMSPTGREILYCIMCGSEGGVEMFRMRNIDTGNDFVVARGYDADWFFKPENNVLEVTGLFKTKKYYGDKRKYVIEDIFPEGMGKNGAMAHLYARSLRNEIFARHGRHFTSMDLRFIYESADWYVPLDSFSSDMLNEIERRNINFIVDYEKKMGWR